MAEETLSEMGLYGLAVMGQNFALNVAEKGFTISVCNRSPAKVDTCMARAQQELGDDAGNMRGFKDKAEFVASLKKPRRIMFLVKAGPAVDETIKQFTEFLEEGDILIDGGNEWYQNSIRRAKELEPKGIKYLAVGVSGGEEGARNGPSLMPGGPRDAWDVISPIFKKCAAIHTGNNQELHETFTKWNEGKLDSFLIEITSLIFAKKDVDVYDANGNLNASDESRYLVDMILDCTGNKGTGKMTIKEGAEQGIACPTMASALDSRFISFCKDDRVEMSKKLTGPGEVPQVDRDQLLQDVEDALYASKICSYAQGMNLIKAASKANGWDVNLGDCARIWRGGCIIRAKFLDLITQAYERDPDLPSLLIDPFFMDEINSRQSSWRRVVALCVATGIACPSMSSSLAYFDAFRRERLSANLLQAQRDFFGSHTFERTDKPRGEMFHCKWTSKHA
eukprot:g6034.t1